MDSTINSRTPEEIKKGLECCSPRYESKHWVSCSSECPFRNEGAYCRNVLHACNKKYIQLLEDGIDRVYKQVDALRGLPEKIQQIERERDAAVKDIARTCLKCAHRERRFLADGKLDDLCGTCIYNNMCNWEWRGVQEVQHGTE